MPFGEHLARCLFCGKRWIVGDCIPAFCSESCSKAHAAWWNRALEQMEPVGQIRSYPDTIGEAHEADRV